MAVVCNNRSQLLLGCGATALAVALTLAPQRAAAQAFQASPLVVQGNADIDRGTPGQDLIQVNTPTAVIDWTPIEDTSGNALDFLPTGNIASFYDAPGQGGFAVLNRILPATNGNVVVMNGTVISSLQGSIAGTFSPGGFVAFYSPTGFLIGSSAVFDVGGLMLTSLDPDLASFDNFAAGAGSLNLLGQSGTTARITISPGANIVVTPEDGFFIAAAAGLDVFGNVSVNGSHAYIAAEQVNLTINNGLFDIVVPVGTSVANAMNINGNVGGPSSTGAGDNHIIYAVAQAAANPIQMLFGGNLGFAPAASAGVINGEIILSGNYDVFGRSVNGGSITDGIDAQFVGRAERSTTQVDIDVIDANISSSMLAISSHTASVEAIAGPVTVAGDLLVAARQDARVISGNSQTFLVTGDLLVASNDAGQTGSSFIDPNAINGQAGTAFVDTFNNGILSINGNAKVTADANAGLDTIAQAAGSALGGSAFLGSSGGALNIAGNALVSASAVTQGPAPVASAGTATAGIAHLQSNLNGAVNIGGTLSVLASAVGADVTAGTVFSGSDANGGLALVNVINGAGSVTVGADVVVQAAAFGGAGNGTGGGGISLGGEANINTASAGAVIDIAGSVDMTASAISGQNLNGRGGDATGGIARMGTVLGTIIVDGVVRTSASGTGGNGVGGGHGVGGIAGVFADQGSTTIGTSVEARANGTGGSASFGFGGQGGIGQGGLAFLDAARSGIASASLTINGNAQVESNGIGGSGGNGDATTPAGQGGEGRGGAFGPPNAADPTFSNGAYALAQADYGTLTVTGQTFLFSDGTGGTGGLGTNGVLGGTGGIGSGGSSQAGLYLGLGNGSIGLGSATFADVVVLARANGGSGGITVGATTPTGLGGNASGGFAAITAPYGTVTAGATTFNAQAAGGTGSAGGSATGGTAGFDITNGGDVTAGNSQASAAGIGGTSTNGVAGNGTGGQAIFNVPNGNLQINGTLSLSAPGFGGAGTGGVGGNGTGGSAGGSVTIGSATITGSLIQDASGSGGQSIDHAGGNGIGGRGRISTFGGTIAINSVFSTNAVGFGGDGIDGGNGTGGIAGAFASTGSITIGGAINAIARGFGGDASFGFGGLGGTGTGGNAFAQANGTLTVDASVTIGGNANILADGTGGRGGDSDGTDGPGGRGGDGIGGSIATVNAADSAFNNGAYLLAQGARGSITVSGNTQVFSVGLGGNGGNGQNGFAGGAGGSGVGGTAQGGLFIGAGAIPVPVGQARFGNALIRSTGIGGAGGLDSTLGFATGNGGNGTGGGAFLTSRLGVVQAGTVTVEADGTGGTGAIGGIGQGGDAGLLTTNGGRATLGALFAYSRGAGGFGQAGTGGTGTGGEAFIGFQGGTANITGDATIIADGFGGQSIGADGATGTGGIADIATFTAVAGNATIGGTAQVTANGFGGQTLGTGFTGGTGQGGEAYLLTQVGGTLQINAAQVAANGIGGSGPSATGGAGTGGIAYIESRDAGSSITISNTPTLAGNLTQSALLVATGGGGDTTGGTGVGGTGTGGTIDILATNGGTINLPMTGGATTLVRLFSRGFGGGSSVDGGTGGLGVGGTGTIDVDGGTLTGGPLHLSMFAQGGSSLNSAHNITGGNAQGGNRFIVVQNGGVLSAAFPGGIAGGVGGDGSGTGAGGNGFGGLTNLEVIGGTANLGPGSILIAQNSGGSGATGGNAGLGLATVLVDSGGVINILPEASGQPGTFFVGSNAFGGAGTTGPGGNATPQTATVLVNSGSINGGNLVIAANAIAGGSTSGVGGNADAGTSILTVNSGGTINLAGVRVEADGVGGISGSGTHGNAIGGDALIQLNGANYTTSGDTVVHAVGQTGLDPASGTTGGSGGAAQGGAAFMLVEGASQVTTGKIDLNSNADAFQAGNATGGSSQLQLAHSTVNTTELVLTSVANSRGGAVAAGSSVALVLRDTGGASTLTAGTATFANGASGATSNVAGQALIETTNSTASFDILNIFSTASTGGSATEVSVDGGSMPISGALNIEATGGINISAINGAIVGGPTVTAPTATIRLDTPGTVRFSGNNDNLINFGGRFLSINSGELNIENGARIGADSIALRSLDTAHTAILGGTTEEVGYTLLQAEAERIEAGEVTFTAPLITGLGANDPDVLIRDLTIIGTLDDGVSSVSLDTPGIIRVEGVLVYQDAAATDSLSIFAGQRLEVVTPGGIGIVDADGNPAGVLELTANNLWVGDADLIGQLQADPNFAGRDEALKSAAAGSDDPLGYIRGGSINIGVGETLFVRNTGTSEAPGGILIGDGTLSIRSESFTDSSSSSTPISVFAYGAKRNSDGTLVTGEAFYDLVNFNKTATASGRPGTSYVDGSMFNDCDINTDECEGNVEEIIEAAPPVNNPAVVEAPTAEPEPVPPAEEETSAEFGVDFPGLVEVNAVTEEGTLDDGVMSGGDSSLYAAADEDDSEDDEEDEETGGGE